MNGIKGYNLRVYGLLIHENEILVTDEVRSGFSMTKFPGGGLEKGEGLADCLVREFKEELGEIIKVDELFYVNDFLQISAFSPEDQLFSFYYFVSASNPKAFPSIAVESKKAGDSQTFKWMKLDAIASENFTFPIDKEVVKRLKTKFLK